MEKYNGSALPQAVATLLQAGAQQIVLPRIISTCDLIESVNNEVLATLSQLWNMWADVGLHPYPVRSSSITGAGSGFPQTASFTAATAFGDRCLYVGLVISGDFGLNSAGLVQVDIGSVATGQRARTWDGTIIPQERFTFTGSSPQRTGFDAMILTAASVQGKQYLVPWQLRTDAFADTFLRPTVAQPTTADTLHVLVEAPTNSAVSIYLITSAHDRFRTLARDICVAAGILKS